MKNTINKRLKDEESLKIYTIDDSFMDNRILICKDDFYEHSVQIFLNNEDGLFEYDFQNDNKIGVFVRINTWSDDENVDGFLLSIIWQLLLTQEIYEMTKTNIITFDESNDHYFDNFIGVIISKDNDSMINIIKGMMELLTQYGKKVFKELASVEDDLLNNADKKKIFTQGVINFSDLADAIKESCYDLISMNSDDYLGTEEYVKVKETCKKVINIIDDIGESC